jgi:hypothetical protein
MFRVVVAGRCALACVGAMQLTFSTTLLRKPKRPPNRQCDLLTTVPYDLRAREDVDLPPALEAVVGAIAVNAAHKRGLAARLARYVWRWRRVSSCC